MRTESAASLRVESTRLAGERALLHRLSASDEAMARALRKMKCPGGNGDALTFIDIHEAALAQGVQLQELKRLLGLDTGKRSDTHDSVVAFVNTLTQQRGLLIPEPQREFGPKWKSKTELHEFLERYRTHEQRRSDGPA